MNKRDRQNWAVLQQKWASFFLGSICADHLCSMCTSFFLIFGSFGTTKICLVTRDASPSRHELLFNRDGIIISRTAAKHQSSTWKMLSSSQAAWRQEEYISGLWCSKCPSEAERGLVLVIRIKGCAVPPKIIAASNSVLNASKIMLWQALAIGEYATSEYNHVWWQCSATQSSPQHRISATQQSPFDMRRISKK